MQVTIVLEEQQWQLVLNQLGEGSINRVLPLYMVIQQQLIRQQKGVQQTVHPTNGAAHPEGGTIEAPAAP